MGSVTDVLNAIAPLMGLLLGTGAFVKWMPFMKKVSNDLIPLLNGIVAFLALFGASTANASIFGSIAHEFGLPAKILLALVVSGLTSKIHDKMLKNVVDGALKPILSPTK